MSDAAFARDDAGELHRRADYLKARLTRASSEISDQQRILDERLLQMGALLVALADLGEELILLTRGRREP